MQLLSWTLLVDDGYVGHWFLLHEDNEIKTIHDFLLEFLERFGDDEDEFTLNWLIILWTNGRGRIF
jgi:hypothetical protein